MRADIIKNSKVLDPVSVGHVSVFTSLSVRNGDEADERDGCGFFGLFGCGSEYDDIKRDTPSFDDSHVTNWNAFRLHNSRRPPVEGERFKVRQSDDGFANFDAKQIKKLSTADFDKFTKTNRQLYVAGFVLRSLGSKFMVQIVDSAPMWLIWKCDPMKLIWGIERSMQFMKADPVVKNHPKDLYINPLIVFNTLLRKTYEAHKSGAVFDAVELNAFLVANWQDPENGMYYAGVPDGTEYYLYFLGMSESDILPAEDTLKVFRKMGVRNGPIEKVRELIKKRNEKR